MKDHMFHVQEIVCEESDVTAEELGRLNANKSVGSYYSGQTDSSQGKHIQDQKEKSYQTEPRSWKDNKTPRQIQRLEQSNLRVIGVRMKEHTPEDDPSETS